MIETTTHDDHHLVRVRARRIDVKNAEEFKDRILELLAARPANLILDLSEVDFIDSTGLTAMISMLKALGSRYRVALAGLDPRLASIFSLARLDRVFVMAADADAAADSLGRSGGK